MKNSLISCVIVDDELRSCEVLKKMLLNYCDDVNVVAIAQDIVAAAKVVEFYKPDLVFLDIEMQGGDGFTFLQQFTEIPFRIIFVTAYDQYAIRAIRYSALDYLLKPLSIEDVRRAVSRYRQENYEEAAGLHATQFNILKENTCNKKVGFSKMAIPTLLGYEFLEISDIVWLQAADSYTIFHLANRTSIVSSSTLKRYEELLCEDRPFVRIHHSFIINLNHAVRFIKSKQATILMSNGKELEVSVRKKEDLLELLQNHR